MVPANFVLPIATMARKLAADVTEIDIPAELVDRVDRDRAAGVDHACEMVESIRDCGAFEGAHLIPVSRYREVADQSLGRRGLGIAGTGRRRRG